jgi:hypothetical protein
MDTWEAWLGEDEAEYASNPWLLAPRILPYRPLQESPALFHEFASLADSPDAFLGFALKYGPLIQRRDTAPPDRLRDWARERDDLRGALAMLDVVSAPRTAPLEMTDVQRLGITVQPARSLGLTEVKPNAEGEFVPVWSVAFLASNRTETEARVKPEACPREIIQAVLGQTIARALLRHGVAPTLVPDGGALGVGLRLSFSIQNLAGAIWLQFALAVDGERTYRTCPVCGKWWDATDARAHKMVCSDKCRAKKSYQARKGGETNDNQDDT